MSNGDAKPVKKKKRFTFWWSSRAKKTILPGFEGLSLYDLIIIFYAGIVKGTFSARASAISFSFFMALFPFLLFLLNLIPFVDFIDDFQIAFLDFIDSLLPPDTSEFFNDILFDIAARKRGGLLSFVFLLSIFLMANGVNAVFTGFEFSYHTRVNRSIIRQYFIAVGVSLILALLLLTTVVVTVYLTFLTEDLKSLGVVNDAVIWADVGRYIVFVIMIYLVVAILYYSGTKESRLSRFFSIGAFVSTALIVVTTFLFGIYIENFSTYNELYGSIGALLILMVYIWINSNILLLGFELNASLMKLKRNRK
ncbi:YihY/virulence factor BrkB family protein [Salinimicrobium oceani]|uniref:YihY/virulence factor BrkB family protein n=1 Tax=Salinimicrobium oceani TaxID=2722702 RepID=A0ABX1D073_9FLAO|nr:YihY/virulence factor BrkB family protein [Salinimicrobium oceani]NJW52742.1 YihY/virulence factor BrkB family protein [Salinimicrobium oceani]